MADTTSFQNKYRGYLEDDADTYLKPEGSGTAKFIAGTTAAVGLLFGGSVLFKNGAMKSVMHSMIGKAGRYRKGKIQAVNQGIRNFAQNPDLEKGESAVKNLLKGNAAQSGMDAMDALASLRTIREEVESSAQAHKTRMENVGQRELRDTNVQLKLYHEQKVHALEKAKKENVGQDSRSKANALMDEVIAESNSIAQKEQKLMLKQVGFRYMTIDDAIKKGEINEAEEWIQEGIRVSTDRLMMQIKSNTASSEVQEAGRIGAEKVKEMGRKDFLSHVADKNIFIDSGIDDASGAIADLRDFKDTYTGFINSLATEFTIPLVKINPLRMFYVDQFFDVAKKPIFDLSIADAKNPIITGHNGPQGTAHLFVDGTVYNLQAKMEGGQEGIEKVAEGIFLADAQKGPIARLLRNMSGISISKFNSPGGDAPFTKRARYEVQSALDIGFQDEPMGQFDIFDPTSWGASIINVGTKRLRMDEYAHREDYLRDAFGKNVDYIYMQRAKSLKESASYKDFLNQFAAGRTKVDDLGRPIEDGRGMKDVTLATMFPYGFFERLNATMNQIGLGLSNKSLGSASEVFGNLLLRRVAPIWAGIELWDYLNYESEELLGFQFEDRFAQMYANSSIEVAKLRDNLGVTDWAKGIAPLIVGGEHIAEIPFLGHLLEWNKSAEETEEYWENGEDPVRKGRWWPLGNTPYTGSSIDYFEPNWVRRTMADAKFTDSQYGSREEYFANSWMPTPRHPLAPIRHFFTDPYHWEEKHYLDRPYMVTGGIPEFENFPLIGPVLNSTIGQVLKPQKMMHGDMWYPNVDIDMTQAASGIEPLTVTMGTTAEGNYQPITTTNVSVPVGLPTANVSSNSTEITDDVVAQILASYSTSSGQTAILAADDQDAIFDAQAIISEKSPMSTGRIRVERMPVPEIDTSYEGAPAVSASFTQMLGNLHYNASEMGGFYGFIGTSMTGEMFKNQPVLQSSDSISSYTRAFWDLDIGGFGGDANEIFRRFVPKDRKQEQINTIPNTMPDWLPGNDYFVDFQTGDPYIKVKKGELRLPGGGYEALNNIDSEKLMGMSMGASFIGYDEAEIRTHLLKGDAYKDEALARILKAGTKWHNAWESEMARKEIAVKTEQYVKDEASNIGGFYDVLSDHEKLMDWMQSNMVEFTYYEASDGTGDPTYDGFFEEGVKISDMTQEDQTAFYDQLVATSPTALIDPKTRGTRSWEQDEMHFKNVQQVNFYATQVGTPVNYLIHVDRQQPEKGIKVFAFEQNDALLEHTVQKVEGVRQGIHEDIEVGKLHRADLYEMVDRYRILADVAPYSNEFRTMKSQISGMNLSEEEMEEISNIDDQVSAKRKKSRFYQYRFKTANIENDILTVDHVIDSNTFIAKEFPDNPVRLAGVSVSIAQDNPLAERAAEEIGRVIRPGAKVKVAYDANENGRIKGDTYKTLQAVVYDNKGRNLNKYLIDEGIGKEKDKDYSPAAVHARFSPNEIQFGANWEKFAHLDTMIHTKLLQVRSPIESYERREVYGQDWAEWTDPIEDFLVPAIQNSAMHNPILAIAGGTYVGAAFGSLKATDMGVDGQKTMGRYGKIVGAFVGASVMGLAVLNRMVHESVTGERWIPERRQQERATEEYFDILDYIKYNALYNKYAELATREEKFDVKGFIEGNKNEGSFRKAKQSDLERIKRSLYAARPNQITPLLNELRKEYDIDASTKEEAMKLINAQLNEILNSRELNKITPLAAKAIMYQQASKQTMYGYEAGDPISNILTALPKKDRDYLLPFIESPEEEHERILQTVPNYMKRVLQSAWGMPVDEKMPLQEYFQSRPLPSANWGGWKEDVTIDDIKVKFVDNVGLDPSEFNIWPTDQARAREVQAPAPDVFAGRESAQSYERKLKEILTGFNVQGTNVNVVQSNQRGVRVEMDINQNREDDVQRLINREGYHIL